MATVANLGQAFYDSLVYFLRNATALDSDFADRFYIVHPTLNLSLLTLPFVLLNPYRDDDEVDVQPDYTGYESRWMTYHFTIQVYCTTYAKERELPELVKRTILSAEVGDEMGFQVYSGIDSDGAPDAGTELVVADPELAEIYHVGSDDEEDKIRKFFSVIEGSWQILRDRTKKFVSTDS